MSMYSLPTLGRISRERLSSLILSPTTASNLAVIDVRDDDHVGGHISNSTHVPSSSLDYRIPELVRKLVDKQTVVFHCALSQQRGPSAALRYLKERESRGFAGKSAAKDQQDRGDTRSGGDSVEEDIRLEGEKPEARQAAVLRDVEPNPDSGRIKKQEVYVLDGGFVKWQEM